MASASVPSVSANNVLEVLHAFQKSEILQQTIRFGVYDKIDEAGHAVDVKKLAEEIGALPDTLERLLNAATGLGFLVRTVKDNKVYFANTEEASVYLTKKSLFNVIGLSSFMTKVGVPGFKLEEPVKTGELNLHKTLDFKTTTPEDFFKTLYGTKENFYGFVTTMETYAETGLHILKDLKLQNFKHVVDLGGNFGTHARFLKTLHPQMKVTLADLGVVIQEARKQEYNQKSGIEFTGCDFFDGKTLPKADLYILGHVIHDWTDDQAGKIIRNVYDALNKGGAILLLEKHLAANKDGPQFCLQDDLVMML